MRSEAKISDDIRRVLAKRLRAYWRPSRLALPGKRTMIWRVLKNATEEETHRSLLPMDRALRLPP
jgi:hypothetical protein